MSSRAGVARVEARFAERLEQRELAVAGERDLRAGVPALGEVAVDELGETLEGLGVETERCGRGRHEGEGHGHLSGLG